MRVLALATAFAEGDEQVRAMLRRSADFFPISDGEDAETIRTMMIRIRGEMFLVENTRGGETGVFSLLIPLM